MPVVLQGARERLAVELRDRRAPLAVMESLSDAESLYSLDSRRSSAALRGSPNLGGLPFPLDTPIPEENPSLSSRTELLAADCLSQANPVPDLGEHGPYSTPPDPSPAPPVYHRISPGTPSYNNFFPPRTLTQTVIDKSYHQGAAHPYCSSNTISGPYSSSPTHAGLAGEETAALENERAEAPSKPSTSLPPLPNGGPSQTVLEFAQFLDSLFKLDGSASPPLDLSDGESESGRGSFTQEERSGDMVAVEEHQLLARATLEPNLVPKPPRTFAGSADPSSGISLSPSIPLSSSGELNDLSPGDAVRTAASSPYTGEKTLSSVV